MESDTTYFQQEADQWTVLHTNSANRVTQCYGTYLLGGYGVTGVGGTSFTRIYSSLPAHSSIYYAFALRIIDIDSTSGLFKIYFNGVLVDTWTSSSYLFSQTLSSNLCGDSNKNDIYYLIINGKTNHNATSLNFTILSMASSSTSPSIAFKYLSILLNASPVLSQGCGLSQLNNSCYCPAGQYSLNSSTSNLCSSCYSLCESCFGSSMSDMCTSCAPGSSYNGTTCLKCDSSCDRCNTTTPTICTRCVLGKFLYRDGTCQQSCNSPLIISTQGVYQYCNPPCNGSDYYYRNCTCHPGCPSSFLSSTQNTVKYCDFSCGSSLFRYPDGSCNSTCNTPLVNGTLSSVERYCNSPCDTSSGVYIYQSACRQKCSYPFVNATLHGINYCHFLCETGKFLYWNKTCHSTCGYPYTITNTSLELYCNPPCNSSSLYLYENKSCLAACPAPYVVNNASYSNVTFCTSPCSSGQYYSEKYSNCSSYCNTSSITADDGTLLICQDSSHPSLNPSSESPTDQNVTDSVSSVMEAIQAVAVAATNFLRPSSSHSAFVTALAKLVKYVKYLRVPLLPRVRDSLSSTVSPGAFSLSMTFTVSLPDSFKKKFEKRPIPFVFCDDDCNSSYLVNHWQTLSNYIILIGVGIASLFAEKVTRRSNRRILTAIIRRLRIILAWNFFLFILLNTYDDLTFFPILEFYSLKLDSTTSVVSFLTCIISSGAAIYMLWIIFQVSWQASKLKKQVLDYSDPQNPPLLFYRKWQNYQVIYAGCKNTSFLSQAYVLVFLTRVILCYLFVGLAYMYPLVQTTIFLTLSLLMFVYLFTKKPIKDRLNFFVILVYEYLVLVVNSSTFVLAMLQKTDTLTDNVQTKLSELILIANTSINTCSSIFTWVYILSAMWSAFQNSRKLGLGGKTSWINVLVSSYQNAGLDFHEASNHLEDSITQEHNEDCLKPPAESLTEKSVVLNNVTTLRSPNVSSSLRENKAQKNFSRPSRVRRTILQQTTALDQISSQISLRNGRVVEDSKVSLQISPKNSMYNWDDIQNSYNSPRIDLKRNSITSLIRPQKLGFTRNMIFSKEVRRNPISFQTANNLNKNIDEPVDITTTNRLADAMVFEDYKSDQDDPVYNDTRFKSDSPPIDRVFSLNRSDKNDMEDISFDQSKAAFRRDSEYKDELIRRGTSRALSQFSSNGRFTNKDLGSMLKDHFSEKLPSNLTDQAPREKANIKGSIRKTFTSLNPLSIKINRLSTVTPINE